MFCARKPDARQPGLPLPVMFQPVCHPLQAALRFLHPPIPHTHQRPLRFACLTDVAGRASGRDCHVPRVASIPRLGFVFPRQSSWYRITLTYCDDRLRCRLAGADNCRRPVNAYGGSGDDSHVLAMRVGSLASTRPCNSDAKRSPSPDNTLLRARHC